MCYHQSYQASAEMTRLYRDDEAIALAYVVELKMRCRDCNQDFRFKGVPFHITGNPPTVPAAVENGYTLLIPVEPEHEPTPQIVTPARGSKETIH